MKRGAFIIAALLTWVIAPFYGVCQDTVKHVQPFHPHPPPLPLVPQFPGGKDSLTKFIKEHTEYPADARQHNISGTIEVDFIVTVNGDIKDPKVLKPLGYGCDEEAIKVVKQMPRWKPGRMGRDPMELDYHVLIPFGNNNEPNTNKQ